MNEYIYISSRKIIKKYLEDNFNNIKFISRAPRKRTLRKIIKEILKNSIKQVIIEDYFVGIQGFIEQLNNLNISVKIIWINGLATLNEEIELGNLIEIINLLKNKKIKSLGFVENNIYEVYKDIEGVKKVSLTVKSLDKVRKQRNRNISIYGDSYDWRANYFNQLSAVKLLDNCNLIILDSKNIAKRFCKFFNIENKTNNQKFNVSNFRKLIKNLNAASCVEFSNSMDLFIIDSYNHGVPVTVGNNTLFFKDTELQEMVVVNSDDDINEISEKIDFCLNNSKKIIESYKQYKKKYDIECKNLIKDFIKE